MQNKKFKPIQIPCEAYDILKKYCELHDNKRMARVLERLINENLKHQIPLSVGRIKLKTPMESTGVKLSSK
jgi:hypothetical protein